MSTFADKISSAADSAARIVKAAADPKAVFLVPAAVKEARLRICRACEHWQPETSFCKDCACFMPVKAGIAAMICPLKPVPKWTEYVIPESAKNVQVAPLASIFELESRLREALPPDSAVPKAFNAFHASGGCKTCQRQKRAAQLFRTLIEYLYQASDLEIASVRTIFTPYTHLPDVVLQQGVDWNSFKERANGPPTDEA